MKELMAGPEAEMSELVVQFAEGDEAVASIHIRPLEGIGGDVAILQIANLQLGFSYFANMLFDLGEDPAADALLSTVIERGVAISDSPELSGRFYLPRPDQLADGGSEGSKWRAVLRRSEDGRFVLDTFPSPHGDPRIMSRISTLALFDHLRAVCDERFFVLLIVGLGAITDYYKNQGTTHAQGRIEGPERAMLTGAAFIKSGAFDQ